MAGSQEALDRFEQQTAWPMMALALAIIPTSSARSGAESVQALPEAALSSSSLMAGGHAAETIARAVDHACRIKTVLGRPSGELHVKRRHAG